MCARNDVVIKQICTRRGRHKLVRLHLRLQQTLHQGVLNRDPLSVHHATVVQKHMQAELSNEYKYRYHFTLSS